MGSTAQRMICERHYPLKSLRNGCSANAGIGDLGGGGGWLHGNGSLIVCHQQEQGQNVEKKKMSQFHKENVGVIKSMLFKLLFEIWKRSIKMKPSKNTNRLMAARKEEEEMEWEQEGGQSDQ